MFKSSLSGDTLQMSFHILGTGKERYRQIRDLLYIAMRTDYIFIGAQRFFLQSLLADCILVALKGKLHSSKGNE